MRLRLREQQNSTTGSSSESQGECFQICFYTWLLGCFAGIFFCRLRRLRRRHRVAVVRGRGPKVVTVTVPHERPREGAKVGEAGVPKRRKTWTDGRTPLQTEFGPRGAGRVAPRRSGVLDVSPAEFAFQFVPSQCVCSNAVPVSRTEMWERRLRGCSSLGRTARQGTVVARGTSGPRRARQWGRAVSTDEHAFENRGTHLLKSRPPRPRFRGRSRARALAAADFTQLVRVLRRAAQSDRR